MGSRLAWQENIAWADHILIVHPYWWGAMPTKAKAVLDRALTSASAASRRSMSCSSVLSNWLSRTRLQPGSNAPTVWVCRRPPNLIGLIYSLGDFQCPQNWQPMSVLLLG
ncbi:MAG: hypothetical protein CBC34_002735 [Hyphomicrobiaceae bacterium TMED74]|nr:hypothetical protein [Filomicrobium sp.]RPG46631.1 MAG: hypothetical protein CBC34_002735 [Hyphomicrobiaceae bacterium TMED74]